MFPGKHIAISVAAVIARPGADLNLKRRIVAVYAEEIVHRRLRVRFLLPAFADLDVVHEVERPQVIVDVDIACIRTAKPRNFVVELAIHLSGLGGLPRLVMRNDLARGADGLGAVIVHGPGHHRTLRIARHGDRIMLYSEVILESDDGFGHIPRHAQRRGHARVNTRPDTLAAIGVGPRFHRAAFPNHHYIIPCIKPNGRGGDDTLAMKKTVAFKSQRHRLGRRDDRGRCVIGRNEFLLANRHAADLVFANHLIRPPPHALRFGMLEGLSIDDHAAVEHAGILIKLPTVVVVALTGVLRAGQSAVEQAHTATAEVVMKRMRQADCLVLHQIPTRMKASDVIGKIARHEPVLAPLNFLLQSLAVIGERRLFTGEPHQGTHQQQP